MRREQAVVLLSSGMDSAVCASLAAREYRLAFLHVQYGQKSAQKELECFQSLCDFFKPERVLIAQAPFFKEIGASSLTVEEMAIPEEEVEGIPTTYVPFRNGIFLSIAAAWAEAIGAKKVFIGVNQVDFSGYPDCREAFIKAFEKAILEGTRPETQITLEAPLLHLSKKEIVALGMSLGTPFERTWSCYQNTELACGRCASCKLRLKAFQEAGFLDPIPYQAL